MTVWLIRSLSAFHQLESILPMITKHDQVVVLDDAIYRFKHIKMLIPTAQYCVEHAMIRGIDLGSASALNQDEIVTKFVNTRRSITL